MRLTKADLCRGAVYAIEQAGHLIRDAVTLYESGRYASSLVLGVYCREELGRSDLLLAISQEPEGTSAGVDLAAVWDRCKNHIRKLQEGQEGVTLRIESEQGRAFRGLHSKRTSPEYKAARASVQQALSSKRKRDPADTHERRLRALYVDPREDGTWHRPSRTTAAAVFPLLDEIACDYRLRIERLRDEADLLALIDAMPEPPILPVPVAPSMPT